MGNIEKLCLKETRGNNNMGCRDNQKNNQGLKSYFTF